MGHLGVAKRELERRSIGDEVRKSGCFSEPCKDIATGTVSGLTFESFKSHQTDSSNQGDLYSF